VDSFNTNGRGQMRLAGARAANEYGIVRSTGELGTVQSAHQVLPPTEN